MKLNKHIREAVCKNAMEKTGLIEEVRALVKRYAAFAEKCRVIANEGVKDSIFEAAEKKFCEKVPVGLRSSKGARAVRRDSDIILNLGGLRFRLDFSGENGVPDYAGERLRVPHGSLVGEPVSKICPYDVTITDSDAIDYFHQLEAAKKDLEARILTAAQYVSAYVNSVPTAKALIEAWPEAEALIPKDTTAAVSSNLPAIRVEELNKIFNLPEEK